MKILFMYPTMVSETPMTLGMLSAVAKQEGWETKAVVNTFKKPLSVNDLIFEATKWQPDIVAISMITFEVLFVYELIRKLRKAKFTVIIGGPHPTDCPLEAYEAGANVVVQGEGEDVLRDILNEHPNIKQGIRDRKPPVALETLPLPDLEVFDKEVFEENGFIKGFHRIYTSRGCPGTCTFCDWQVFKQNWRPYPVDTIIKDIKRRIKDYGIKSFSIADDCFTVDRDRAIEFCKKIKQIPNIVWRTNSRADLVDLELLKIFKDSGCHSIAFGLESGDEETLLKTAKRVSLEKNIETPRLAHEAGLEVYGCMMTGFPWETPDSVNNNIKFIKKTWGYVSLYQVSGSLMPFPGSVIYRQYAKRYNFEKYWLKPEYQKTGIQVYQNSINPYKVSTLYQRLLFDDTYIQKEMFFKYSKDYKKAVQKMVLEIGRHNLRFMFKNPLKEKIYYNLARLSMVVARYFPNLEKQIIGKLFKGRSKIELTRDKRRGITKNYEKITNN